MIYETMRRSVFVCLLLFVYHAREQVSMPGSFSAPFRPFCGERAIQAVCRIRPNPNIDTDLYRDVHGMVILTQRVTCYNYYALQIKANIAGLPADGNWSYHGFHIHESGDFSDGCQSTGFHYNPLRSVHGAQSDPPNRRHVGGLGNVVKDPYGNIQAAMFDNLPSLVGDLSVVGRAIVLHEKQDDLGRGSNDESLRTGNAGRRIACCRIEPLF